MSNSEVHTLNLYIFLLDLLKASYILGTVLGLCDRAVRKAHGNFTLLELQCTLEWPQWKLEAFVWKSLYLYEYHRYLSSVNQNSGTSDYMSERGREMCYFWCSCLSNHRKGVDQLLTSPRGMRPFFQEAKLRMPRWAAADETGKWRWLFSINFLLYIKHKGNDWNTFIHGVSLEPKDIY